MTRASALRAALSLLLLVPAAGCATPRGGLWPPAPGEPTQAIFVSVDTWHAMIAFPLEAQPELLREGSGDAPAGGGPLFEEWGYAERAWYLEGRQGLGGALRALFWPSEGVVEVAISDRIWAERTPQPPADAFIFYLSETGYRRLRQHLLSTLAAREPIAVVGASRFYPARDAYHLFHQCHQYAARALREAGLPVSPAGAFTRTSFVIQLRRVAEFVPGRAGAPDPGEP